MNMYFFYNANNEDPDQTAYLCSLIIVITVPSEASTEQ